MNKKETSKSAQEAYDKFMRDFNPSPYINTEWEQQNGFYKQYSEFDENCVSISGTVSSIKALQSHV